MKAKVKKTVGHTDSDSDTYPMVHNWAPVRINMEWDTILWVCKDMPCQALALTVATAEAHHNPPQGGVCPATYDYPDSKQVPMRWYGEDGKLVSHRTEPIVRA